MANSIDCPVCSGSGMTGSSSCSRCRGTGAIKTGAEVGVQEISLDDLNARTDVTRVKARNIGARLSSAGKKSGRGLSFKR